MHIPLHRSTPRDAERNRLVWAEFPADRTTPVGAFLALRAAGRKVCLLDSAEGPERLARYSFLGVDPIARFRSGPDGSTIESEAGIEHLPGPSHAALAEWTARTPTPPPPAGLPPFRGGWIGWFSYEWAHSLEARVPLAANDPWGVPEATFDLYRDVVAFDHAAQKLFLIAGCEEGEAGFAAASERIDALAHDVDSTHPECGPFRLVDQEPQACMPRADFESGVEALRHDIAQGEMFQAVLSQRFEQRFDGDAFTLYRVLRLTNPSPHMFFFEADGLTLIGSSPERLVSVIGGRCQVVPIAGTRARHIDPEEDERLGAELRSDPKECAEHDMLVDLARNDLGRIGRLGSVQVKEHRTLQRFARVQHLVSRVECDLAGPFHSMDALAACFPAGTVSGAPKIRAMERIAELERDTRGPYAGAFGYLDGAGNLDTCISIRTMAVRNGVIHIQAGAGVVFESDPAREYLETLEKAQALFEAVRAAESPAFGNPERTEVSL